MRSAAAVANEMQQLFDKGVRIFIFDDDDLGTKQKIERVWIEQFARELEKRDLASSILWSMFCRADEADVELLGRLRECGLAFVCMGIESGNPQGLKTLNKGFHVDDVFRAVETLEQLGIFFEYGFMMFDPGSTFESVRANLAFLERLCKGGRAPVRFTKMVPLMGTPIARTLTAAGRLTGTISAPNYGHLDGRLDLLEMCWAKAFGPIAFNRNGLVDRLRSAKKDVVVLGKFLPGEWDIPGYGSGVTRLMADFNESVLDTMRRSLQFMESRNYADILYYWRLVDSLCEQEWENQNRISKALEKLVPSESLLVCA
jgi:hypothetical protein